MSAPYPLIEIPAGDRTNIFEAQAITMAAAHNTFIQGLNAITHHALKVPPQKVPAFLTFCLAVFGNIHHHHYLEETFTFPEFEKRLGEGTFSVNVHQHEEFVPQLNALEEHLKAVQDGKEKYDGEHIVNRIQEFSEPLLRHLREEIKTLESTRFSSAFTEKEMAIIEDQFKKKALADGDLYIMLPLTYVCADPANPWFPPLPTPIKWATRWWFSRRYSESWEFGPMDLYGNQRPLID